MGRLKREGREDNGREREVKEKGKGMGRDREGKGKGKGRGRLGCPAKRIFFLSVRTETNRNTDSFRSVPVFFPKEYYHLLRFVPVF